jgi:hypothetical protein
MQNVMRMVGISDQFGLRSPLDLFYYVHNCIISGLSVTKKHRPPHIFSCFDATPINIERNKS